MQKYAAFETVSEDAARFHEYALDPLRMIDEGIAVALEHEDDLADVIADRFVDRLPGRRSFCDVIGMERWMGRHVDLPTSLRVRWNCV